MILGKKAVPLARLVKTNRQAADLHDDGRAPSWDLHDLTLSEAVVSLKTVVTFVTWLISRAEFSNSELVL